MPRRTDDVGGEPKEAEREVASLAPSALDNLEERVCVGCVDLQLVVNGESASTSWPSVPGHPRALPEASARG